MSLKDTERWMRLAALGAKGEIPTPKGEARMSAVILQIAEPLIKQSGKTEERAKSILMLCIAGWNKSVFPADKRAIVQEELIDRFAPENGSLEAVGVVVQIMDYVADMRERLFPDIRKVIVDYAVEIVDGDLTLNVSSAPIQRLGARLKAKFRSGGNFIGEYARKAASKNGVEGGQPTDDGSPKIKTEVSRHAGVGRTSETGQRFCIRQAEPASLLQPQPETAVLRQPEAQGATRTAASRLPLPERVFSAAPA